MVAFKDFFSSVELAFLIIIVGYVLGKIKICGISFDLSAILVVSVLAGWLFCAFSPQIVDEDFQNCLSFFSKLGTSLFISSIGLGSGLELTKKFEMKKLFCFMIGIAMVMSGIGVMDIINAIDRKIEYSLLKGVLCGALTSTPGLSALCESQNIISEQAVLGYGCAYLFGVIGVVLFVQLFVRKNAQSDLKNVEGNKNDFGSASQTLIYIIVAVVVGTVCDNVVNSVIGISLGRTGGILVASILLGFVLGKSKKTQDSYAISSYRTLGLMMFFVGSGVPAGMRLNFAFEPKWIVYGVILTSVPLILGAVLSHMLYKTKTADSMAVVAGGMTSTPAISVIMKNAGSTLDLSSYSFAYIGALLAMVIMI